MATTSKKIDSENLAVTHTVAKDELLKQKRSIEEDIEVIENQLTVSQDHLVEVQAQLDLLI